VRLLTPLGISGPPGSRRPARPNQELGGGVRQCVFVPRCESVRACVRACVRALGLLLRHPPRQLDTEGQGGRERITAAIGGYRRYGATLRMQSETERNRRYRADARISRAQTVHTMLNTTIEALLQTAQVPSRRFGNTGGGGPVQRRRACERRVRRRHARRRASASHSAPPTRDTLMAPAHTARN
jgi:hypothetical protein